MSDLVEFLLREVAADEAAARAALPDPDDDDQRTMWESEFAHRFDDGDLVLRFDPARVLVEVEAKRAIVAEAFEVAATIDGEWGCCHDADDIRRGYREPTPGWGDEAEPLPESCQGPDVAAKFLWPLASVFADRPGFDETWRP